MRLIRSVAFLSLVLSCLPSALHAAPPAPGLLQDAPQAAAPAPGTKPDRAGTAAAASADAAKAALRALLHAAGGDPDADFSARVPSLFSPRLVARAGDQRLAEILSRLANDGWGGRTELLGARLDDGAWKIGARSREGLEATFALELAADGRIDAFGVEAGLPVEVPRVPPSGFAAAIDKYLDAHATELSGTVVVAHDGVPLVQRAFGLADRATGRRMTLDTPINLGSMNKMFTGVAIGQLVAAGKLHWSDTVGRFLPDYPNATVRDRVTIAQLANHTAGIPSYWNEAYEARKDRLRTQQDFLDTIQDAPLAFEPGTRWEYSNGGPVILGRIIEAVTGQDYYAYVRSHVYAPLGMAHSGSWARDAAPGARPSPSYAIGYWAGDPPAADGGLVPNSDWLGRIGSAAGGGYASAPDLLRFAEGLRTGRVLDRRILEDMWIDREVDGRATGYGYLFGVGEDDGHRWVGHTGGAPGVNAFFRLYPEAGYTVVVLSNVDHGAIAAGQWISQLIQQNLPAPSPPSAAQPRPAGAG